MDLLGSYLSNRSQSVQIYVNDFYDSISGEVESFEDKSAVFYINKTWANLKNKAENYFDNIISFFRSKHPTLNMKKTKFVMLSSLTHTLSKYDKLKICKQDEKTELYFTNNIKYSVIYKQRSSHKN